MKFADALPTILQRANDEIMASVMLNGEFLSYWYCTQALDIFECLIRIDDVALRHVTPACCSQLDQWSLSDPKSLAERIGLESNRLTLAVLLALSPRALGELSDHISLFSWMEIARAANRITADQLARFRPLEIQEYLCGRSKTPPSVKFPTIFPFPAPSVMRMVQNLRFRRGLLKDDGYREAMRRYIRFFC